jgi:hypothetical protein
MKVIKTPVLKKVFGERLLRLSFLSHHYKKILEYYACGLTSRGLSKPHFLHPQKTVFTLPGQINNREKRYFE